MEYMHLESRYGTTLPRRGTGSSGNGDMRSGSRGFTGKRNISHTARVSYGVVDSKFFLFDSFFSWLLLD